VLFIEVGAMPGTGKLTLTGQLGDVMRESAQAALSWVRGHADGSLPEDWFARHDLHIHVPAGAIPKDGPSAGVTMVTALVSMLTGRPVRDDVAMTGEVTLHGEVLPIGGLKEKALAAQRLGIRTIIAPSSTPGRRGDPRTAARAARLPLHRAGRGGPRHCARAFAGRIRLERSATRGKSRMAAKSKAAKASAGTAVAGASPYVQRLVQDAELRDNLRTAYESGRSAYGRLSNGKAPAKVLLDDKKLHRDLQNAADSLRTASDALREGPQKKKRKGGIGRLLLLAIVGGGVALGASSDLRNKALDLLFGAEEEFDYTSTTAPAHRSAGDARGDGRHGRHVAAGHHRHRVQRGATGRPRSFRAPFRARASAEELGQARQDAQVAARRRRRRSMSRSGSARSAVTSTQSPTVQRSVSAARARDRARRARPDRAAVEDEVPAGRVGEVPRDRRAGGDDAGGGRPRHLVEEDPVHPSSGAPPGPR
jgi:hypothetical protein